VTPRDYDLVVYSATGFVGRQAVRELAAHPEIGRLRWAIAGRDRARLEALAREHGARAVIVADARDVPAIEALVARTRVVLALAGPFSQYADAIVAACASGGTHYADITGETPWVRTLIDRYHDRALASGTRIVPGCGFDSVPSDLGAFLVARLAQRELGADASEVRAYYTMAGGANGGTLATLAGVLGDPKTDAQMRDPELLTPEHRRLGKTWTGRLRDPVTASYDVAAGTWVAPFFMGPINTRVVRRSAALSADYDEPYAEAFSYQEYFKFGLTSGGPFAASAVALGTFAGMAAMRMPGAQRAVAALLPPPGTGPSQKAREGGWFRCELIGFLTGGRRVYGTVAATGDPGNVATSTFAVESALALALDGKQLPGGSKRGGVLTPATAIGDVLVARLRARGMTLEAGRARTS